MIWYGVYKNAAVLKFCDLNVTGCGFSSVEKHAEEIKKTWSSTINLDLWSSTRCCSSFHTVFILCKVTYPFLFVAFSCEAFA